MLLIGAGGLGSPAALYLAAAGVGTLGIVDMDVVDLSNLQRQVIHTNDRVGMKKIASARRHRRAQPRREGRRLRGAADQPGTSTGFSPGSTCPGRHRHLRDALPAQRRGRAAGNPVVHASVFRFEGQVTSSSRRGALLPLPLPAPPPPDMAPACAEAGVLGVLPGIMGLLQANEVLKLLLGIGEPLAAGCCSSTPSRPSSPSSRCGAIRPAPSAPTPPAAARDAGARSRSRPSARGLPARWSRGRPG